MTAGPLQLERPLVTFDIESTGLNVTKDRIVEIAAIKLMPDGTVSNQLLCNGWSITTKESHEPGSCGPAFWQGYILSWTSAF